MLIRYLEKTSVALLFYTQLHQLCFDTDLLLVTSYHSTIVEAVILTLSML